MPRQLGPVTFTCEWCEREVTEERLPGPTPRYCLACRDEALKASTAARVRKHRMRNPDDTPWWRRKPRGRPKKY